MRKIYVDRLHASKADGSQVLDLQRDALTEAGVTVANLSPRVGRLIRVKVHSSVLQAMLRVGLRASGWVGKRAGPAGGLCGSGHDRFWGDASTAARRLEVATTRDGVGVRQRRGPDGDPELAVWLTLQA